MNKKRGYMPVKANEMNFLEKNNFWEETFFEKIDYLKVKIFCRWSNRRRDIIFSEFIIPFSVLKIIIVP